jgi:hypothetical protein
MSTEDKREKPREDDFRETPEWHRARAITSPARSAASSRDRPDVARFANVAFPRHDDEPPPRGSRLSGSAFLGRLAGRSDGWSARQLHPARRMLM